MHRPLPALRLTGAQILRDGALRPGTIGLADGVISDARLPEVDLSGYLVLPGIVDLHGDSFERHIAPRPSAPFPIATGLASTDRDAAANGITTAYMAQSWSWEGGHRGPDFARALLAAVDDHRPRMLTDLRVQIRCETHTTDTAEDLLDTIAAHGVGYVVFNNHLDEALAIASARPAEFFEWARRAGRSPDDHIAAVSAAKTQARDVPRYLCKLAERFDALGVIYGSHDDTDGETRETFSMIGAKICEFPTSRSAAALARAVGDPVLMGAPNILRGGSQAGNIAAIDLVRDGLCDALVSDYHYPALAGAAWRLVDEDVMDLPEAWAMISSRPAEILRLADRGTLDAGQRADLVVVDPDTRAIEATISGGRIAHLSGEAARRFCDLPERQAIAAE
ncbi:alpha-D-ribose 1-methylphosphonate 5-triphosphate diphosphatase [Pseudooceanicola sp. LIPI14-2-Ac024]|uniref:alpha-D-ribose 1-methylphosphonate 5-triphosphate diphosphatase n=1 Tax=Pseudooceanicola sp. LIPI14-2-Ac024 TaxID=3344875 RepID=UPI0035D0A5B1